MPGPPAARIEPLDEFNLRLLENVHPPGWVNPAPKPRYHLVVIETEGFFRVHLKRGTDRILGATLVAEHAGEMIGEIGVAIVNGVGLGGIGRAIHPYPTQAEVFRKAADTWQRGKLTPGVRGALGLFFRVFG